MATPECDRFGDDLSAYLDGELPDERVREIEQHLLGCESCRGLLEQLREIADRLAELPRVRAPGEFTAELRRVAEQRALRAVSTPLAPTPRTWKLFARVGASAALIAACMFAGWQVYERMRVPAAPSVQPGPAAMPEERMTREGFAGRDVAARGRFADPSAVPAAEPGDSTFALADKAKRVEAGELLEEETAVPDIEAVPGVAAGVEGNATGLLSVEPRGHAIHVYITPRDAEQSTAVRTTLVALEVPAVSRAEFNERAGVERYTLGVPMKGVTTARGRGDYATPPADRYEFFFQLEPAQVSHLIDELEQQAPEQVLLSWADAQRVRQAAQARPSAGRPLELQDLAARRAFDEVEVADAAPAAGVDEAARPPTVGEPLGGGGAGKMAAPEKRARAPAVQPAVAGRRGGRVADTRFGARREAREKGEEQLRRHAAVTPGAPASPATRPTLREDRLRAVAALKKDEVPPTQAARMAEAPASQPVRDKAQLATQPMPGPIERLHAAGVTLREQLGELMLDTFGLAATQPAPSPDAAPPQRVTVRVTLLPPPSPATQPVTRPVERQ